MLSLISFAVALVAAVLWGVSATRQVPDIADNLDTLHVDLQLTVFALRSQSRWSAAAAWATGLGVILQAAAYRWPT
jgi:hypothetical protein